ncbi:thioredoxin family protein [Bacillus shivajii]|uniref:thioredoxin family protein n=1 Tax=Bacillus shivajii TaxID=1983719 RepID=UPI001CFA0884|nr:thioredoxin family protein [Bacillus shivajii]UCZ54837.1 thioredoxin family protein [Bacillus shivajii]
METIYSEEELTKILKNDSHFIYFFTPICGTCHIAHQFLTIIEKLNTSPTIHMVDINYIKVLAKKWQIESVPCLAYIRHGEMKKKLYKFESVTNVYQFIQEEM